MNIVKEIKNGRPEASLYQYCLICSALLIEVMTIKYLEYIVVDSEGN